MIDMKKAHAMARSAMKFDIKATTYRNALSAAMRLLWKELKQFAMSVKTFAAVHTDSELKTIVHNFERYQGCSIEDSSRSADIAVQQLREGWLSNLVERSIKHYQAGLYGI
ncbi:hypothetical protein ACPV5S_20095 [Vibrio astriarenae]